MNNFVLYFTRYHSEVINIFFDSIKLYIPQKAIKMIEYRTWICGAINLAHWYPVLDPPEMSFNCLYSWAGRNISPTTHPLTYMTPKHLSIAAAVEWSTQLHILPNDNLHLLNCPQDLYIYIHEYIVHIYL